MSAPTPETLAELRRLLAEFREMKPGRATVPPQAAAALRLMLNRIEAA